MTSSAIHLFDSRRGQQLLVVDGSRIYDIDLALHRELDAAVASGEGAVANLLDRYGLTAPASIDDRPLTDPPLRALSLAVAQACNLACGYCYAKGGEFGGKAQSMEWQVARAAIDRLIDGADPGGRVSLAFLGGEPLLNRHLIREATSYAIDSAGRRGVRVGFSLTTNGTMFDASDADFFEKHGFAVTVSMDGTADLHDRLRPFRGGRPSHARIVERLGPLLARRSRLQISARVTVTPLNLSLIEILDDLIGLGFGSVGFSPMLSAPSRRLELEPDDLAVMLDQMIACGQRFEAAAIAGQAYPFANIIDALREIHRGAHRPYPCGAGAGYFGVSAEGGLFACHRFVNDDKGRLGDLAQGIDRRRRNGWLADRHVHRQEPCGSCWARYLCGGGCHHEVIHRGRPACDFIRGWLDYCLRAYVNLSEHLPDRFFTADKTCQAR